MPQKPIPGTVRVGNKRSGSKCVPLAGETVIDGDRKNPILGNRHILKNHNDPAERSRVIEAYSVDLKKDVGTNGPMSQAINTLANRVRNGEKIILMCWCAPKPCHLDQVASLIRERAGIRQEKQGDLLLNVSAHPSQEPTL
jgi:hypothetical protein